MREIGRGELRQQMEQWVAEAATLDEVKKTGDRDRARARAPLVCLSRLVKGDLSNY